MAKLLVTGANGQLGSELRALAAHTPLHSFSFVDLAELDLCQRAAVEDCVKAGAFDWIINCAAYTAVDRAEEEPEAALRVNRDAVENLALAVQGTACRILHISTDYVYGGTAYQPYRESDKTAPRSVYGQTKYLGEEALAKVAPDSIIIRTAWLYSSYGNNFVKTMLRLGQERELLAVVDDQIGTPTYAGDLANAILTIVSHPTPPAGIYNFTDEGVCSWYDFARTIHSLAGISCNVQPVSSETYGAKASRPPYSVLNKSKIKETFGLTLPWWEESLKRCIDQIQQAEKTDR